MTLKQVNVRASLPLQVVTAENVRMDRLISLAGVCLDVRIVDAILVAVLMVSVKKSRDSANVIQEFQDAHATILLQRITIQRCTNSSSNTKMDILHQDLKSVINMTKNFSQNSARKVMPYSLSYRTR